MQKQNKTYSPSKSETIKPITIVQSPLTNFRHFSKQTTLQMWLM